MSPRQTLLLLALGMLIASALAVGVSGWMLFVRERRLAKTGGADPVHHEATEEH